MRVAHIGKAKQGAHVRGRLNTSTRRKSSGVKLGRLTGALLSSGFLYAAVYLAPSYKLPLLYMGAFVGVGGFLMDYWSGSRSLLTRLIGPILALGGLLLVTWLLLAGQF
jgi:hypothetical protein